MNSKQGESGGVSRVFVLGSINLDYVIKTKHLPHPGETVLGDSLSRLPGGKGANQAVAAVRLGAEVSMFGCVGRDDDGEYLLSNLSREGILTEYVGVTESQTGTAFLSVAQDGENSIVVVPGANREIVSAHVEPLRQLLTTEDVLVLQLEVPLPVVAEAARTAQEVGARVILNAAPAQDISTVLTYVNVLVVNEHEAACLFGASVDNPETALKVAKTIRDRFGVVAIITLGGAGAVVAGDDVIAHVLGESVDVVDTTGAGDTFVGALASALTAASSMDDAVKFAVRAASYSCTGFGAQSSMPHRTQLSLSV